VGLPVFNAERYLAEALDSLLAQTFTDFELIVSDNGSRDATEEICRSYARQDGRVLYHRHPENRGAAWNFNYVFHLARGKYFRWAAYDDLCAPTHLERLVEALEQRPSSVVLCYTATRLIDETGAVVDDYDDRLDLRAPTPGRRLVELVRNLRYANPTYGLIRREALSRTRLLGSYPSADLVLLGELALLGEFHEIPERLFFRRVHPKMSTRAHRTAGEVLAWFDPSRKERHPTVAWRLLREYIRAIWWAPIPWTQRWEALLRFLPVQLRASHRQLLRETIEVVGGSVGYALARLSARAAR
jgi:glycosyltransferase involved in cell wall biosynthesis